MSGEHLNNKHGLVDSVKRVATSTALVVAGFAGWQILHNGIHVSVSPLIEVGGSTPPKAKATVNKDTYNIFTQWLQCSNAVTVDVGVNVHSSYFAISGFDYAHLVPVDFLECGPQGYILNGQKTVNNVGKTIAIKVSESNYSAYNAGVDFSNGSVLCMNLPPNSTNQQIAQAKINYDNAAAKGQTINCNFGAHTTGAHLDTGSNATADIVTGLQSAVIAAEITPVPGNIQKAIINTVDKMTTKELKSEYPSAKITVIPAKPQTELSQIETAWQKNKKNFVGSFISFHFIEKSNSLKLLFKSIYGGASGDVYFKANLTPTQVTELNQFCGSKK